MWKFANQNLSRWRCREAFHQFHFLRLQQSAEHRFGRCYLTTAAATNNVGEKKRPPKADATRGDASTNHPPTNFQDGNSADRFLHLASGFLAEQRTHRSSSSLASSWNVEDLKQASDILHIMSQRQVPKELLSSWIPVVDELMCTLLKNADSTQPSQEHSSGTLLLPDSNAFSSAITMCSKCSSNHLPHAAERADYWLQEMIRVSREHPSCVSPPRASLFAAVLGAWEKSNHPQAVQQGDRLWKQLQDTPSTVPTSSAYYLYLSLWSKKTEDRRAPEMAEAILREMIAASKTNPKLLPTLPAFVNVISCWRKSGNHHQSIQQEVPYRAHAILDLLLSEHKRRSKLPKEWMRMEPLNDVPFNATIHAWAVSGLPQAEQQIDSIIRESMGRANVAPTMITTWSALPLFENSTTTTVDVPAKICSILEYTKNKGGNQNPMLLNQIYGKALGIVCRIAAADPDGTAASVANEILQRYLKLPRMERRIEVTMESFERVVEAWKHRLMGRDAPPHVGQDASERIAGLLEQMEQEADRIYRHKKVSSVFVFVARTWAKSGSPNALSRTEEIANRLLDSCKEQSSHPPRMDWFHDIIRAVKDNFPKHESDAFVRRLSKRLAKSSQLFQMIENARLNSQFDEDVFCGILDCLADSNDHNAGKRAEIVLLKMQELHEAGGLPPPTFDAFHKVLNCWSNSQEEGAAQRAEEVLLLAETLFDAGDDRLRPSLDGYISVVTAWSQSHSPEAPDRIQRHLRRMRKLRSGGATDFVLDDRVYAALIQSYANSGRPDANSTAQAIFDATPDELKTVAVYNSLIAAQGGDSNKAEAILQMMHYEYTAQNNTNIKPNTETFNCVLLAWLRSASPMAAWRADGIFKRMLELSQSGKLDVRPNSKTFDLVISTLAQDWGAELGKVDRYLELLKEYYQSGAADCVPTVTSYTEAIRAWGSNSDDPRAVLRAKALLDEMHELARAGVDSVRPNRGTYEVYLKALSQSCVEGRIELVNDVLAEMKSNNVAVDGQMRPYIKLCMINFERDATASVNARSEQ